MKKILLFIFLYIGCVTLINAQESVTDEKANIEQLQNEIKVLKQELKELKTDQKTLSNLSNEVESVNELNSNFLNTFNCAISFLQWFVSIITILSGAILGFIVFGNNKSMKDYKQELEEKSKKELDKINDQMSIQIAQILNKNPIAIKEFIEKQLKEQELRKNKSIHIIYKDENVYEDIRLRLMEDKFANISASKLTDNEDLETFLTSINTDIILIADIEDRSLCNLFNINAHKLRPLNKTYFYYGSGRFEKLSDNQNFANSPSTLTSNLSKLINSLH